MLNDSSGWKVKSTLKCLVRLLDFAVGISSRLITAVHGSAADDNLSRFPDDEANHKHRQGADTASKNKGDDENEWVQWSQNVRLERRYAATNNTRESRLRPLVNTCEPICRNNHEPG